MGFCTTVYHHNPCKTLFVSHAHKSQYHHKVYIKTFASCAHKGYFHHKGHNKSFACHVHTPSGCKLFPLSFVTLPTSVLLVLCTQRPFPSQGIQKVLFIPCGQSFRAFFPFPFFSVLLRSIFLALVLRYCCDTVVL